MKRMRTEDDVQDEEPSSNDAEAPPHKRIRLLENLSKLKVAKMALVAYCRSQSVQLLAAITSHEAMGRMHQAQLLRGGCAYWTSLAEQLESAKYMRFNVALFQKLEETVLTKAKELLCMDIQHLSDPAEIELSFERRLQYVPMFYEGDLMTKDFAQVRLPEETLQKDVPFLKLVKVNAHAACMAVIDELTGNARGHPATVALNTMAMYFSALADGISTLELSRPILSELERMVCNAIERAQWLEVQPITDEKEKADAASRQFKFDPMIHVRGVIKDEEPIDRLG